MPETVTSLKTSETIGKLVRALAKAGLKFEDPERKQTNEETGVPYADLPEFIRCTRRELAKNGLILVQVPETVGDRIRVTSLLAHHSGEWLEGSLELTPHPDTEPNLTAIQQQEAAITNAKRIAYKALLNLEAERVCAVNPNGESGKTAVAPFSESNRKSAALSATVARTNSEFIAQPKRATFWNIVHANGRTKDEVNAYFHKIGIQRTEQLKESQYENACRWASGEKEPEAKSA